MVKERIYSLFKPYLFALPSTEQVLQELQEALTTLKAPPSPPPLGRDGSQEKAKLLAQVAVHAWRSRKQMTDAGTGLPYEQCRKATRHIESLLQALQQEGISISDIAGTPWDTGMAVHYNVLAYEPEPGFIREAVKDTIKPTIFLNNECVLRGDVIVGVPPTHQQA